MNKLYYLHFTLGPVQAFVAQARRTRDFWAGSFLLSWLSAIAMREVKVQGGAVIFPRPNDDFIRALTGANRGAVPKQGNVPNRFKAEFLTTEEQAFAIGQAIESSVRTVWDKLALHIYTNDLAGYSHIQPTTQEIWQQQIENFWDIAWVVTADVDDAKCLDRRKYWRSYLPPEQAGVKCMMMEGWQELSGLPKQQRRYPTKSQLAQFWQPIQQEMQTDLREGEMLCAIGFIKRRFVRHFASFECQLGKELIRGWALSPNVPSVAYMAGIHWLEGVLEQGKKDKEVKLSVDKYLQASKRLSGLPEMNTLIYCLERQQLPKSDTKIDGNVFHPAALENQNIFPNQYKAYDALSSLLQLKKHTGKPLSSPFYAVLLMDGDSIGKLLQSFKGDNGDGEQKLSEALKCFTEQVEKTVYLHNGFLVYAGGDDVLAILPLEDALSCAAQLRSDYEHAFTQAGLANTSTLSGAIQYAHIKVPLTKLLNTAHDLLDRIAKAKTGRDAIAVRVQLAGGVALEWSMPWKKALLPIPRRIDDSTVLLTHIESLAYDLQYYDEKEGQFSNQLLFKVDEYFSKLESNEGWREADILGLLLMAYRNSGKSRRLTETLTEEALQPLLLQSQIWHTGQDAPEHIFPRKDAILLMRFLAHKGVELP